MYKYAKEFKKESIPHISEQKEIVDTIHNYSRPSKKWDAEPSPTKPGIGENKKQSKEEVGNVLEHGRPTLTEEDINSAKKEI